MAELSAQKQRSNIPAIKGMRVNCFMTKFTKNLNTLMSNQDIRSHLHTEINKSSKRENIIFLDEFLTSATKVSGLPEATRNKANKLLSKATIAKKLFSNPAFEKFMVSPEIDVYFPVSNHRDTWTGNDDLLIGVGVFNEDTKEIKAYSVKNGKVEKISTTVPSAKPMLMVSPCEHKSHESEILENIDTPEVAPVPSVSQKGYIQTNYFKITDDSEPWWKGDPEIYVWVTQYSTTAQLQTVKKYLPGVNDEGVWKHLRNCPTALSFFWDENYNVITYYRVMEEDGGTIINLSISLYGLTVKLPIRDDDDDLGSVNVHRDEVGWCPFGTLNSCCSSWTKQVSTGKALMRLTKAK